jgi:hypothetical protein
MCGSGQRVITRAVTFSPHFINLWEGTGHLAASSDPPSLNLATAKRRLLAFLSKMLANRRGSQMLSLYASEHREGFGSGLRRESAMPSPSQGSLSRCDRPKFRLYRGSPTLAASYRSHSHYGRPAGRSWPAGPTSMTQLGTETARCATRRVARAPASTHGPASGPRPHRSGFRARC